MVSRESFEASLTAIINGQDNNRKYYTRQQYDDLRTKIRDRNAGVVFTDKNDYRKVSQFNIEQIDNVQRLKHKKSGKILIHVDNYYDILQQAHDDSIHGGRDTMLKNLRERYFNINERVVAAFLKMCPVCERKRNKSHRKEIVKPILTHDLNGRCQVDLIDYQTRPDREYKFVLVYQDHLTKYVLLRPLKTKHMDVIAEALFQIFIDFGAPLILHSDNGREFKNQVRPFSTIIHKCCIPSPYLTSTYTFIWYS